MCGSSQGFCKVVSGLAWRFEPLDLNLKIKTKTLPVCALSEPCHDPTSDRALTSQRVLLGPATLHAVVANKTSCSRRTMNQNALSCASVSCTRRRFAWTRNASHCGCQPSFMCWSRHKLRCVGLRQRILRGPVTFHVLVSTKPSRLGRFACRLPTTVHVRNER